MVTWCTVMTKNKVSIRTHKLFFRRYLILTADGIALFQKFKGLYYNSPTGFAVNYTSIFSHRWYLQYHRAYFGVWPKPVPALGTSQSWEPSMSCTIWTRAVLPDTEHAASRTRRSLPRVVCYVFFFVVGGMWCNNLFFTFEGISWHVSEMEPLNMLLIRWVPESL